MAKKQNPRRQPFTDGSRPGNDQLLAKKFFEQTRASLLTPIHAVHQPSCIKATIDTGFLSGNRCECACTLEVRWPGSSEWEAWTPGEE